MSKNQEDVEPPVWMNKDLVAKALQHGDHDNHGVDFSVRVASSSGDNNCSTIYRVTAKPDGGETRSIIFKEITSDPALGEFVAKMGLFQREIFVLEEVMPKIQALLDDAAPGRWPALAPRCLLHGAGRLPFVAMEDLGAQGFRMADRVRGLGLRHSLLALRALARLHAGSCALLRKAPPALAAALNNPWRTSTAQMDNYLNASLQAAADACASWTGFEEYATLIENFKEIAKAKLVNGNDPKSGAFNVIIHGDFWMNNLLYKYDDDGNPCDIRVVDFQFPHIASPTLDLHHFLSGNTSENVSIQHLDLLLREYYFALQETMNLFGMQAPPLETLQADMDRHSFEALFFTLCVLPSLKSDTVADIDAGFAGDNSGITFLYNNPVVKKWFQRVLPEYKHKGWFSN